MTTAPAAAGLAARPPNREAERITGRPYLSHSQLSLMRSCPRRFAFRYVERAAPDFVPGSLIFGGSVHAALELFFCAKLEGLGVTPGAMLSAYHDAWRRQKLDAGDAVPVRFNKGESFDTLHALAGRMIGAFMGSPLAQPKGVIVGVEEEMRVVLDPELPDVAAKVDLVTQTEHALHVIDFKTSRGSWNERKALESANQLVLYGLTLARLASAVRLPVKLSFAVLTKHKTPRVQVLPVFADQNRVVVLRDGVAQVWAAIRSGHDYPSPSPRNCTACPFRSRCPAFAGG